MFLCFLALNQLEKIRKHLLEIFQAALSAVSGQAAVSKALKGNSYADRFHVIAIGKAADSMFQGVPSSQIISGLVISKHDHITQELQDDSNVICIESDHPVPKEASLKAGKELLKYLEKLPENDPCLFLISGGASSLVEVLEDGWDLSHLQKLTDYLLANAYPIDEMNAFRKRISKIKGGGLWSSLNNRPISCLMISDVPSDDPEIIGSGLLFPQTSENRQYNPPSFLNDSSFLLFKNDTRIYAELAFLELPELPNQELQAQTADFKWKIVASLSDAKREAASKAKELGFETVIIDDFLDGEASEVAKSCVDTLINNPSILHIWGGETTVHLPENAGMGGRNQHLALSAAIQMENEKGLYLLAAGTDGSDGLTVATGALVDTETINRGLCANLNAEDYLERADSNSFFKETGDLIETGATGTNVMDLLIGVKI